MLHPSPIRTPSPSPSPPPNPQNQLFVFKLPSSSKNTPSPPKRPTLPPLIMATTRFPNSSHQPAVEPCSAADPASFAFASVTKRWPMILTQTIDRLVQENNRILDAISSPAVPAHEMESLKKKLAEGKAIISQLSELKYESARDKELKPLQTAPGASEADRKMDLLYNQELSKSKAAGKPSWFTASWLLTECYLYRRLYDFFAQTTHWTRHDPFEEQKVASLRASWAAVAAHTQRLHALRQPRPADGLRLRAEFDALLAASLWGNATDLSLRPDMSPADVEHLQACAGSAPGALLRDDSARVWDSCVVAGGAVSCRRIDIVLDNAGFELFTDLVLADWIVSNSQARVVFHPKSIPWFISDVMEKDIFQLLDAMIDGHTFFFSSSSKPNETDQMDSKSRVGLEAVVETGKRWKEYFVKGNWSIVCSDCWTNPLPFWDLWYRQEHVLQNELEKSDLVIFKGDLNYRKLTGDGKWSCTTRFEEAIGPLDGLFNLLSLRTCKADVVVGLKEGQEAEVSKIDRDWRINGKFGLITFCEKKDTTHR